MQPYDAEYFKSLERGAQRSAATVVPHVLNLMPGIQSVVDVGCGGGAWLREFQLHGCRTLGVDGVWNDKANVVMDLVQPRLLDNRFDLAVSLEVAEHLPAESAERFVDFLCSCSSTVLFSAAVPGQGGTDHVNEQWPWYWRDLFLARGYFQHDPIRPLIANDPTVKWWYRQNMFVYCSTLCNGLRPSLTAHKNMVLLSEPILRRLLDNQKA